MSSLVPIVALILAVVLGVVIGWLVYRAKTAIRLSEALSERLEKAKQNIEAQEKERLERLSLTPTQREYSEWRRMIDARRKKDQGQ